jgi:NAD+ synthase
MIPPFSAKHLQLDAEREVERIAASMRQALSQTLRRRGVVVGLSGGIDSSVTAALAVRALGKDRVFGLLMPERESSPDTRTLSKSFADWLGIESVDEDITGLLEAAGFYSRYEAAVRTLVPGFGPGWKSKLVTSGLQDKPGFTFFSLVAQDPAGTTTRTRLPLKTYLAILAATNFKQRTRKMLEYYHADRLHFAVAGTPNRLEYDQGFFVKNGDGSADLKPIAHLYKTQVYQLAEFLGLPDSIRSRPPTTDTYSLAQGQDEFYFALPFAQMDLCLWGKNHGLTPEEVASAAGLKPEQVTRVWKDIDTKRSTTRYLHLPPLLVETIAELDPDSGGPSPAPVLQA